MGKNNRARRQQKKQQTDKRQKRRQAHAGESLLNTHEVSAICQPLITSLQEGAPPSPVTMDNWTRQAASHSMQPLNILLINATHFLFNQTTAKGQLAQLQPYEKALRKAGLDWLYTWLHVYCVLSDPTLLTLDAKKISQRLIDTPIPTHSTLVTSYETNTRLYAPLYLTLWAIDHPLGDKSQVPTWVFCWVDLSPLASLRKPLNKFLRLKQPKPTQKTVLELEYWLTKMALEETNDWYQALSALLALFIKTRQRITEKVSANWQMYCPKLAQMAGLVGTTGPDPGFNLKFSDADTATLHQLNESVNLNSMCYSEHMMLEALKCRILSKYANKDWASNDYFERQLEQLVHSLSTGVPPEYRDFAAQSLSNLCAWLADLVAASHTPPPCAKRLRRLIRLRPNDYRVQLLNFLSPTKDCTELVDAPNQHLEDVHFALFFRALTELSASEAPKAITDRFSEHFYWSLTEETKRTLFSQLCRRLFHAMNERQSMGLWQYFLKHIFVTHRAPFEAIIRGQSCSSELLLYVAFATVESEQDIQWISPDQPLPLIRACLDLLKNTTHGANCRRVVTLLNALAEIIETQYLCDDFKSVLRLAQHIQTASKREFRKLEPFLAVALTFVNEPTFDKTHRAAVHELLKAFPKLRAMIERQNAPQQPTSRAKLTTRFKQKVLPFFETADKD